MTCGQLPPGGAVVLPVSTLVSLSSAARGLSLDPEDVEVSKKVALVGH